MADEITRAIVRRYLKVSGLMEYPGELYDAILEWVESIWGDIRDLLGRKKSNTKRKKFVVTKDLLKGWKYYDSLIERYPEVVNKIEPELVVVLKITASGSQSGSNTGMYEITLKVGPYSNLNSIGVTLGHELTHWGQKYMAYVLRLALNREVTPGVPSKKMLDEEVRQDSRKKDYVEQHKLHKLDDREFYPLLGSEVDAIRNRLDTLKDRAEAYWNTPEKAEWYAEDVSKVRDLVPNLETLLRYYVRLDTSPKGGIPAYLYKDFISLPDTIFHVTYKHNPEKWKKAVGIFFQELAPYLKAAYWKKALGDLSITV